MEFPKFLEQFVTEEADQKSVMDNLEKFVEVATKSQVEDLESRVADLSSINRRFKEEKRELQDKKSKASQRVEELEQKLDIILDKSGKKNYDQDVEAELQLADLKRQVEQLTAQSEEAKSGKDALETKLRQAAVDSTIRTLLQDGGVTTKSFQDSLLLQLGQRANYDLDTEKVYFKDESENVLEAKTFVGSFLESDKGKDFVSSPLSSGGGARNQKQIIPAKDSDRLNQLMEKSDRSPQEKLEMMQLAQKVKENEK